MSTKNETRVLIETRELISKSKIITSNGEEEKIEVFERIEKCPRQLPLNLITPQCDPLIQLNAAMLRLDWVRDWTGLVCAGGHVLNAIREDWRASLQGDIDIFFVSPICTEEQMIAKVPVIHQWLCEHYHKNPQEVRLSIKGSSLIFFVPNVVEQFLTSDPKPTSRHLKVQLILLKSFESIADLLRSFDLNNCQFAFQDGQIWATVGAIHYHQTSQIFELKGSCLKGLPGHPERRQRRLEKYRKRPYNQVVKCDGVPLDVSREDLIDYNLPHNSALGLRLRDFGRSLPGSHGLEWTMSFDLDQIMSALQIQS